MNNYDYVVLIDENGQPYIAHSWRDKVRSAPAAAKNAGRQAVKYIEKIGNRYFYDPDELKAYYDNIRGRASNAVNQAKNTARRAASTAKEKAKDILGYDERERMRDAERRFNNAADNRERTTAYRPNRAEAAHTKEVDEAYEALKKSRAEYRNTPLAFIEGLSKMAKDAPDAIRNVVNNAKEKSKDIAGFDELERYNSAYENYMKVTGGGENLDWSNPDHQKAAYALRKARADAIKTPIGAGAEAARLGIEGALNAMYTVGSAAVTIASNAKTKVDDLKDFARTVPGRAQEVASNVRETASNVANTVSGKNLRDAQEAYDSAVTAYNRAKGTDDELGAYYDMMSAQQRLLKANPAANIANNVKNTATGAYNTAKEAASTAITSATNTVSDARARAEYNRLKKMDPDDMTQEEYNRWIGYQFRFG